MPEYTAIIDFLSGLPLATLLILVLIGGHKKWWVYGRELNELEIRCAAMVEAAHRRENEWKELALKGGNIAQDAVNIMKKRER